MTKGHQGACPDWYLTIVAAKYLGVHPESLETADGPSHWRLRALVARSAEAEAEASVDKYNKWRASNHLQPI